MRIRRSFLLLAAGLAVAAAPAKSSSPSPAKIQGDYLESRTSDVYTGPCVANSEVNNGGHEAILAWRVAEGEWDNVKLDGLSIVAVVKASATLGDRYANPLPAAAVLIVDARSTEAQRAALVHFARAQAGDLLRNVVGVESSPIEFSVDARRHGFATLTAGPAVKLTTRRIESGDMFCHNEEVYYPPLTAHLGHAMPAVAAESVYRGNHLGVQWNESGRRSAFVATFSL